MIRSLTMSVAARGATFFFTLAGGTEEVPGQLHDGRAILLVEDNPRDVELTLRAT